MKEEQFNMNQRNIYIENIESFMEVAKKNGGNVDDAATIWRHAYQEKFPAGYDDNKAVSELQEYLNKRRKK
jgi:hypothetical protein